MPAVLLGATTAFAETIVVRSNGPSAKSYPPGMSLSGKSKIALQAGDSLTILDERGTSVLKGPGSFKVTATTATGSTFGQFLRNTGGRQARTGATRSLEGSGKVLSPNIWFVDVSKAGNICLADTAAATIWRPDATNAGSITLTSQGDGKSTTVQFAAGQSARGWPTTSVPLTNGGQYKFSGTGTASSGAVTVRSLGEAPPRLDNMAALLIKNGCTAQIDLLVETVPPTIEASGSGG